MRGDLDVLDAAPLALRVQRSLRRVATCALRAKIVP